MTLRPTSRVRNAERSSIRVMYDLAEQSDRDLVRLEVGEPDFDTPAHVTDAAISALEAGETHYTPNAGYPELRTAIAGSLATRYGTDLSPAGISVTVGGMEALHLAMLAVVESGSEVVLPTPSWPNHPMQTLLADGRPVEVPLSPAEGYALDSDAVIERFGPDTAAVVLCSPSNPTGRVFEPEAIRAVVEAAADHDVAVLADEVYLGLTYDRDPRGVHAICDETDHVLTIGSCSKTYAMTGWRVGWLGGEEGLVDDVNKIHESTTACASSVAQYAALAALTGPQEPVDELFDAFRERRGYVVDRIAAIDGLSAPDPQGAFYAFLDIDLPGSSLDIAKTLLTDYGVVLAPGDGFAEPSPGHLRLSFAASLAELERGFDRLERALEDRRTDR
ncbi:pyridoxal phosphate-dependent aminotransferase [Haloferacaceae archaeon DSL9]